MKEHSIKINYQTISIPEIRDLMEATHYLSKALTPEEYISIMTVYSKVIQRLTKEAEKQGVEI